MKLRWIRAWRTKLVAMSIAFAMVPALVVGVLAFRTFDDATRSATLSSLEGIGRSKAEAVDEFIETRRKDVERMSKVMAPYLAAMESAREKETAAPVPEPLADGNKQATPTPIEPPAPTPEPPPAAPRNPTEEDAHRALRDALALMLGDQERFEELLVIRTDGVVDASTFTEHEGKTATGVDYFERGRGATYVQPPFVSPITNELTMVIATPIRDAQGRDVGVLAARLNLKRFFAVLHGYTGLGDTGEVLAVAQVDGKVLFMAPTRHDEDAPLRGVVRDPAAHRAADGLTGSGSARDYRGKAVFAAWRPIPSLTWGLVTKIDQAEALRDLKKTRTELIIATTVVIALAIAISLLISTVLMRPLRQLRVAADRVSKGNLEVEIDIRSHDEIGELADSFERMVAAIKFFRERARGGPVDDDEDRADPASDELDEGAGPESSQA
jgi:HAMP domain-containing protein